MNIKLLSNSEFGEPLTEEIIHKIHGKTFYGEKYKIGDKLGYIGIESNNTVILKNIIHTEVNKFLQEYELNEQTGYYRKKYENSITID